MQILFGETLRRLRREKNLTQEQLSARLNVSFQTISKWERDESYPDITMLPVLASFFGVTTDDLLGVNEAENERKIQEMMDRYLHPKNITFITSEEMPEYLAPLKELVKHNPGDYRLWVFYFGLLCSLNRDTVETLRARLPEIRSVYEMIIENCTNDALRMEAKSTICTYYNDLVHKGQDPRERAELLAIVDELPTMFDSREYTRTNIHSPKTDEEQIADCHEAIEETLDMLCSMVWNLGSAMDDGPASVEHLRSMFGIYDAAFPDGDYGKAHDKIYHSHTFLTVKLAQAGEFDGAFAALRRLVEIARRFEALPQVSAHTSPLLRGVVFDKGAAWPGCTDWHMVENIRRFLHEEQGAYCSMEPWWPEEFKADPRFGEILSSVS